MFNKTATFAAALVGCAFAQDKAPYPSFTVKVDGQDTTLYAVQPNWSEVTVVDSSDITFDHRNRVYFSWTDYLDTDQYFKPNLLGGSIDYDVDLSGVGCSCIAAVVLKLLPVKNSDADVFKHCGGQYRSAYCPEFDVMEANKYGFHTTAHGCRAPDEFGVYHECDHQGQCTTDVLENADDSDYGPGFLEGIDTELPFHVRIAFGADKDNFFNSYTLTMTQGDAEVVMTPGECNYLNEMSYDMMEMAILTSSYTFNNVRWLQHDACTGACDIDTVFVSISNLEFVTTDSAPITYEFGQECGETYYGLCGNNCAKCSWSWDDKDPLGNESDSATCRCEVENGGEAPEFIFGNRECKTPYVGQCGNQCERCVWSWPASDADRWNSEEGACRCEVYADEPAEFTYGADCGGLNFGECGDNCAKCSWSWPTVDLAQYLSDDATCRCQLEKTCDN